MTMPALTLSVQYASIADDLPTRPRVRRWVQAALLDDATVTVRFVDAIGLGWTTTQDLTAPLAEQLSAAAAAKALPSPSRSPSAKPLEPSPSPTTAAARPPSPFAPPPPPSITEPVMRAQ